MQIKPNLPLNTVNKKKSRMPNVANRVDAFVISTLSHGSYEQIEHLLILLGNQIYDINRLLDCLANNTTSLVYFRYQQTLNIRVPACYLRGFS